MGKPGAVGRLALLWGLALCACSRTACDSSATRPVATGTAPPATSFASSDPPPASVAPPEAPPPQGPPAPLCGDTGNVMVFVAPERPLRGKPLRVVAVSDRPVDARLTIAGPSAIASAGKAVAEPVSTSDRHGGPPYFWIAQVDAPRAGKWTASFARDEACGGDPIATKTTWVVGSTPTPPDSPPTALWPTRAAWSRSYENLYSAWIQSMFEAPLDAQVSYAALHEVLRSPAHNFLFDYAGTAEDEQNIVIRPDCADLPYFLRAYFAFKLGLPFGWSTCTRGENGSPPTCTDFSTSSDPFPPAADGGTKVLPPWADPARTRPGPWDNNAKRLGEFLRSTLADAAQSGAGRTAVADEESDYYPVSLSVDSLRPGTIFADPYGHVLVVAQRIAQTPEAGGILLAVDGQPDGTVGRKRFWRGNFLFAVDPALGSAGFKRFRPVVWDAPTKSLRRLKNAELPDYSATDQYGGGVEGFYDKMDDVLSPSPLDPKTALLETVQALEEQVETRVISVENGRKFLVSGKPVAEMPDGAKIFETNGEWEDFSTPSRDLRILVAIDVALGLPGRVARRPTRYAMPAGKPPERVQADLEALLESELRRRMFEYTRTDGSSWKLSLRDVIDRQAALEMAYNPNDCVESRWGATAGTPEASTCTAHAPDEQIAKMGGYRAWFHDRRRPPR
jgi:hypothetical protein